jgi:hypothetical protein
MSTTRRGLGFLLAAALTVGFLVPVDQIEAQPAVERFPGACAHKRNRQPAEARAAWEKGRRLYPTAPEAQAIERELRSL